MLNLIFKDKSSSDFDYMNVINVVTTKQGKRQKPEEQIDIFEIPYRNDELIIHSGRFKPYIQEFEFVLRDPTQIPRINQWLSGRGKLILDNDYEVYEGSGFYIASVIDGWDYVKYVHNTYSFTVKFKVDPFFYYNEGQQKKIYTAQPMRLFNSGTFYCEPYIKIIGNGDITLTINSQVCNFTNVVDYIEIDSQLMVAYKDTVNEGHRMSGDFPILEVGKNNIAWSGNVASVEIITRVRDLG
jgi:phage-related protein